MTEPIEERIASVAGLHLLGVLKTAIQAGNVHEVMPTAGQTAGGIHEVLLAAEIVQRMVSG